MAKPFLAFDYMNQFQCSGPDCEDTCCSGWKINLYRKDYDKLSKLFANKNAPLHKFSHCIKKVPKSERLEENHGQLNFEASGSCSLMEEGWCVLHRDHGEKMLPTVCATFPRIIYDFKDRHEMSGRLSCPEVTRACILSDPVLHMGEFTATLPNIYETNPWPIEHEEHYKRNLNSVAKVIRCIVARDDISSEQMNHLIVYLAKKIEPFFYFGVQENPSRRLDKVLKRFTDDRFLKRTAVNHLSAVNHEDKVRDLVLGVVNARLQKKQFHRYNDLCASVFKNYGAADSILACEGKFTNPRESYAIWDCFKARREQVLARFSKRIDRYFTNFSINFWYQHIYIGDQHITMAAKRLCLYWSVIRFLFLSHPDTMRALSLDEEDQAVVLLDRAVVACIQIFMKNIDSNINLLKSLLDSMDKLGFVGVTELSALLKV